MNSQILEMHKEKMKSESWRYMEGWWRYWSGYPIDRSNPEKEQGWRDAHQYDRAHFK